jgi:hypothetical protein
LTNRSTTARIATRPAGRVASLGGKLILTVIILTVIEGSLRKWVFSSSPGLRYVAYFSKDVIFLIAGLTGAASMGTRNGRYAAWVLLAGVFFILPPSLAHLGNSSLSGAILSFRAYLVLPWCAFLAAGTIRSLRDIDRIVIAVGVLAIGSAALGMLQFQLPEGHILNRYDTETKLVVAQFGHVRAVGPFAYITGMSVMAAAAGWAAIYLFLSDSSLGRRWFAVTVAASGIVCALVSMSRHGLILCLATIIGGAGFFRRGRELVLIVVVAGLGFWLFSGASDEETSETGMYSATMRRFNESDSFGQRLTYMFLNINEGLTEYPFGIGLGIGQPGGYESMAFTLRNGIIENEQGRIVQEIGFFGMLGVVFMRFLVVRGIGSAYSSTTDRKLLALYAASLPMVTLAFLTNTVFNHTYASVTWCVVALVFAAMRTQEEGYGTVITSKPSARRATGSFVPHYR